MASLTCCIDMYDDTYLGLSMDEQFLSLGCQRKDLQKQAHMMRSILRGWNRYDEEIEEHENDC